MTDSIKPDLVYQLKTVSDPSLSPDGSLLAYTLSWVDEESLGSRSMIMLLNFHTGSLSEATQGEKDSAPKFSPDGSRLAFLRSVDGRPAQTWTMAADRDWLNPDIAQGRAFLRRATQVKNLWVPYGE